MHVWARVRRVVHGLRHFGHQAIDVTTGAGTVFVGCSCGRVFFLKPGAVPRVVAELIRVGRERGR